MSTPKRSRQRLPTSSGRGSPPIRIDAARPIVALRLVSARIEPLPEDVGKRWRERFGVDILDGIGSTEMLHIFLANRPGEVRYGTTGKPVPGYDVKLLDEHGAPCRHGEIGELVVNGPSAAIGYWNQRDKTRNTFRGPWTFTATNTRWMPTAITGIAANRRHAEGQRQLGVAVRGRGDADRAPQGAGGRRGRPRGRQGPDQAARLHRAEDKGTDQDALTRELQDFIKAKLAPYKYPRWIEYVETLPKTATGKIQRFKLRQPAAK